VIVSHNVVNDAITMSVEKLTFEFPSLESVYCFRNGLKSLDLQLQRSVSWKSGNCCASHNEVMS
jgi:hypothetical protein